MESPIRFLTGLGDFW